MGGQVCHEGGEIIAAGLEFVAEFVLEVSFERRGIEGDAVGEANLGKVCLVLLVAEESFNKVFAELVPGEACRRIVRVERVPGVAVVDHVGKLLEVAKADSDGTGW